MGMAVASCTATIFTLPILIVILVGLPSSELPRVLLLGLVIGVLSSALPYTIDLAVLKRLPRGLFSVLQSVHPAAAAMSGFLILGQVLAPAQIAGILVISLANVVAVVGAGRRRSQAKRAEEALIA
jgi:inner membrane transporter RhtA